MHRLAALIVLLLNVAASAQSLRFFASPFEVYEGDAVVFNYLEADRSLAAPTVKLSQIIGWRWDFNNDGVWDQQHNVGDPDPTTGLPITIAAINATWYATLDSRAVNGVQNMQPVLQVRRTGEPAFDTVGFVPKSATGVTEDVFGTDFIPDPYVTVKNRSVGNPDLTVNFSVNPRLALTTDTIRLYSTVTPADGRTLSNLAYTWQFTNRSGGASPPNQTVANPTLTGLAGSAAGMIYDVTLTVGYTATFSGPGSPVTSSLMLTKKDSFRVITVPTELQLGRAYRQGFPATYGWDDIVKAYNALGAGNDNYVYFHHLENAFFAQQTALLANPSDAAQRQTMAEIVNELQQGQTMVANQGLITALRIKYPRLTSDVNPNDASSRMNAPAGARTETAAIDTAILDYSLAVQYSAAAIKDYGSDILRAKAPAGAEPFPQFPLYLTFTDPTLSHDTPIPIKNEYWQLTTAFERMELGRVEKAKKLWRLSSQDSTALPEAKAECKTAGTQAYLAMALLAAGQTESDYQANEGNLLLAHVKNARDLFNNINAGVNPLGNDGSFIPNESFAAIYQAASDAVTEARSDQIAARQETRTYQQYQAELRNELQSQRASFVTPLNNLTGLDPALYNNLQTVDDRNDYRTTVQTRVQALLNDYPNTSATGLGDYGSQVISLLDAQTGIQEAINRLQNLAAANEISAWANTQVQLVNGSASAQLAAHDIARGLANGISVSAGVSFIPPAPFLSVNINSGAIISGFLNASDRDIETLSKAQIGDISLAQETRKSLLDEANLILDIRRAKNQYDQQRLKLDQMLSLMDRYIEDLAHARDTAAPLYFQDPTFQVVVSTAMQRAENQLDYTVDKLYRLAKTLQYEWTEGYQNPVIVPANSGEPASLENALFDKFTNTDSLFFIRTADEAYDYISALKAWNSKLRRINVVSVRGPNHSGPLTAVPISLRENILGLKPDSIRGYTLDNSIRDFRNYLATKRVANYYNVANPSLSLAFQTEIDDNTFFPATGAQWNMRINSIAIDVYAESGFSNQQVAITELIQSGTVSLRRFWASPPYADDVSRTRFYVDNPNRSAFLVTIPAKINGAMGGRPASEFINMGLADRPIAATNWILRINTEDPTNRNIDFSKIKDIIFTFTYTYGNPPEFPGL